MSQQGTPGFSSVGSGQPGPNERCWMVADQGRQFGPHTGAELAGYLAVGNVTRTALVWRDGLAQWIPITAVVQAPAYVAPPMTPTRVGDNNKVAAGLCAIFFGGFGVHKFLLGYTGTGVLMLLVSCSCIGYPVMHTIGLIEGIIYLTKSDDEFYREYVLNKKPWF